MGDKAPALIFGLAIFGIPLVLFGWVTLTKKGQEQWRRTSANQQEMVGKLPQRGVSGWMVRNPWPTVAIIAVFEICVAAFLFDSPSAGVFSALLLSWPLGLSLSEMKKRFPDA